jgi:hypothetical protein
LVRLWPTISSPCPYIAAQQILAPLAPAGRHYYIKSHFIQDISDAAIATMVARFEQVTSPLSAMIFQLGNAVSLVPSGDTAFGYRDTGYEWATISAWLDPGESAGHIRWTREFSQAMLPFTKGFYVNQVGTEADEGADLIRGGLRGELPASGRLETQVRPNEPVPP